MSKKTIIYIGGFELPDKNAAAHRVINNGKALRDLGYNVVFIGVHKDESSRIVEENHFGFTCYSLPYPSSSIEWFNYIKASRLYVEIIEKQKNSIQALILYNLPAISMYRLLRFSRKERIKIYSDCTEWNKIPTSKNIIMKFVKTQDIKFRMNVLNKKMDGVISISQFLHSFYLKSGVKSFKIPPLVDLSEGKWERSISNEMNEVVSFVYSGTPFSKAYKDEPKDKLNVLVDAFYNKRSLSFQLNIAGVTKEEFIDFYPTYSGKLDKLKNKVVFHGKLSHLEAIELLKQSDYSIFYRENTLQNKAGFPTKFVEAISAKTAVITNLSSSISDYLIDTKNGYSITENSSKEIEEVISKALSQTTEDKKIMLDYLANNNNVFDYRNFLELFDKMLESNVGKYI